MRIDDRLIHGQVAVGWVQALGVQRIVVVDDDVSTNVWEQELYGLGVPPGLAVEFTSVEQAAEAMSRWVSTRDRTIVLVADVETIARLCERTDAITKINLGGLHDGSSRRQHLAYVYLTAEDVQQLQQLSARGVEISAQDVPTARAVPLAELL